MRILYIIIFILSFIRCQTPSNYFQAILQNQLQQQACEKLYYGEKKYEGTLLFFQDIAQMWTKHIILSGWFMFRSYHQNTDLILFNLVETQNNIDISVGYNISLNKLFLSVQSQFDEKEFQVGPKNIWFYIKTDFTYNPVNQMLKAETRLFHTKQIIYLTQSYQYPNGTQNSFIKGSVVITTGSTAGIQSSCSITKNLIIYWKEDDSQFNNNPLSDNYYGDLSSGQTYLYQQFDFFYTANNIGYLLSFGMNQNPIKLSHKRIQSSEIKEKEVIVTDYINIDEQYGIILNFQAKLQNQQINIETILLTLTNNQSELILIKYINHDEIQINDSIVSGVTLKIWNHFTLIIKNQIEPRIIFIIKNYESKQVKIQLASKIVISQIQFGSQSNMQSIFVGNIRIYKGNFLSMQNNNCYISANQISPQCVQCNSGYNIDYSNNYQCRAKFAGEILEIDDVYNSNLNRVICETGMINDPVNPNNCVCLKGQLNINNVCQQCPKYCMECNNQIACRPSGLRNISTGKCPTNRFDDGISCIARVFFILEPRNVVDYFYFSNNLNPGVKTQLSPIKCGGSTSWVNKYYTIDNNNLNLQSSKSFFFSFAFSFIPDSTINTIIFKYKSINIEILLKLFYLNGKYQIQILNLGNFWNKFQINENEEVWIGLWIKEQQVTLLINSNGSFILRDFTTNISTLGSMIEFGTNLDMNNVGCISLSETKPFQIIKNLSETTPIEQLKIFFRSDKKIIARFLVDKDQINYQQFSKNQLQQSQVNISQLEFPNSLQFFSTLRGFTFTNNYYGIISQFENKTKCALSFHFVIVVNEINMQTPLISYNMNGFEVKIFLIQFPTYNKITLRICFGEDCQDASNIFFYINDIVFILIQSKQESPYSKEIYYQTFDLLYNYKRDTLSFVGTYSDFGSKIDDFKIGYYQQDLQPYNYTIYNLEVVEGDGFYNFSYDYQPCFAFMNLSEMKCLFLKKEYVYCDDQIILESDCQSIAFVSIYHYFHNKYTQQYILTKYLKSKCPQIAFDEIINDIVCTDPTSPYFRCQSGYFKDDLTLQCKKCSENCAKCEHSSTNCIACKNPTQQQLPSCNCKNKKQFLNKQFECQDCSIQCDQCLENENLCTTCSEKRVNPPFCVCDPQRYSNDCVEIQCQQKCQYCKDTPANCITCSQNREKPPLCQCEYGFEEKEDGSCQQCMQNQYYDIQKMKCIFCKSGCNRCFHTQCLACSNPFILQGGDCVCINGQSKLTTLNKDNELIHQCVNNMDVQIIVELKQTYYEIQIIFTDVLQTIDFQQIQFQDLIQITIPVIQQDNYYFQKPRIEDNKIIINLILKINVSIINGYLLFLQNEIFVCSNNQEVLNEQYLQQPIPFKIGPFFLTSDEITKNLDEINQKIIDSSFMKSGFMSILNKIQFFFYILNTLQPSSLFLLIKAQYPPHLYKFYQIIGQLIFPFVPDYQSTIKKNEFYLLGYRIEQSEIQLSNIQPYKNLGYSSSLLVDIPLIIVKYTTIAIAYITLKFISIYCNYLSHNNLEKIKCFLFKRLEGENEINMLSLLICIFVQIIDPQQDQLLSRYGFYFAIVFSIYLAHYFYMNYLIINQGKGKSQENNNYYQLFTERIEDRSNVYKKNYFLIQYAKKYAIFITILFLYNFPIYTCSLISIIFFSSTILTIVLRPYKNNISRLLKIFGELLFTIIWILHIILVVIESTIFNDVIIDNNSVKNYNLIGTTIIVLLFLYNLVYFIEFIYSIGKLLATSIQQKLISINIIKQENIEISKTNLIQKQKKLHFRKMKQQNSYQQSYELERQSIHSNQ